MPTVVLLLTGLASLLLGAELVVRSGSALALRIGVPPLVVGLTVVSIGTSLPELAIGIDAVRTDNPGLAVGNVLGTNLVNLLLILGLSAAIAPVVLDRITLRRDLPAMVGSVALFAVLAWGGTLHRLEGALLLLAGVAYTVVVVRTGRPTVPDDPPTPRPSPRRSGLWSMLLVLVAGMGVIVLGAELLVDGAVHAARSLGVSDAVIGLTIVAIGTSAPELVTTVVSTIRGSRDIAIGNLIGSSTYNIVLVLGTTVLLAPDGVPVDASVLGADLVLLVAVTAAAVPAFVTGGRITRAEGTVAMAAYAGYLGWLLATRNLRSAALSSSAAPR